jgi:peptidoglycan hydrolase CwlO-like protein
VELAEFNQRQAAIMREIRAHQSQIDQANRDITRFRGETGSLNNEIAELNRQIVRHRSEIGTLEQYISQVRDLFLGVSKREAAMCDSFTDMQGRLGRAQSFATTMRFARFHNETMSRELTLTKTATANNVSAAKQSINVRISQKQTAISELRGQINTKNRRISDCNARINSLSASIGARETDIRNRTAQIRRLEAELRSLQLQVG